MRYEGFLFIVVLSVLFFITHKKEKRKFAKFAFTVCVYILILLPSMYVRIHDTGDDGLTSHVIAGATAPVKITANEANQGQALVLFVANGFESLFKYLGWMTIPYFVFLIPIGLFFMFKNEKRNRFMIIFSVVVLSVPALYAYSRGIQETRYLLILIPFFAVFSLFVIEKITIRIQKRNIVLFLIIIGILASSLTFLELKKIDLEYEREAFEIAQQVTKITNVTNVYYPESKYLKITTIPQNRFPLLSTEITPPITTISTDGSNSVIEFIKNNKNAGLTHLVADSDADRPQFLKDLFNHDEKYPYLTKVFDSNSIGFKYHVKVYKINYDDDELSNID